MQLLEHLLALIWAEPQGDRILWGQFMAVFLMEICWAQSVTRVPNLKELYIERNTEKLKLSRIVLKRLQT